MIEKTIETEKLVAIITELFRNNKQAVITVTGNSMAPLFYHKKSRVTLVPVTADEIKKYDILLFRKRNGKYALHRAVNVKPNTVDFCGDAETEIEKGIKKENVIAKVSEFYRKKKIVSVNNLFYKIYSVIWVALLNWRKTIMKLNKTLQKKR